MLYLGPDKKTIATPDWQQRFQQLAADCPSALLQAYYQAGVVAPDTRIAQTPLMALDLETTGLNPAQHDIISIGLVPVTGNTLYTSQARHWLVKSRSGLPADSVQYHRITDDALANAPDLLELLPEFLDQIAGKILLVHCADIERRFLASALIARLGVGLEIPVIDTMALEARLHRARPQSLWQRWRKQPQTSIRLAASRSRYGLPDYLPHHAVTDALACAELFQAQLADRFDGQTPVAELWS
ncbi:MAG: DNA polymerase III subunit epsilon [Gammaproteobacteria bacterium]|nr:DNA polymerase III subunit epsilon [Gammaproteobacteria bacterium]